MAPKHWYYTEDQGSPTLVHRGSMHTNLFIHEIYLSYRVETEYSILDFQSVSYKVQPQINFQGCIKSLASKLVARFYRRFKH